MSVESAVVPQSTSITRGSDKRLMLFGGRASMDLAETIATQLGVELGQVILKTFTDGEVYCRYMESVRGSDLFLVQSLANSPEASLTVNDSLMELLVMIDAAVGASARRVTAVVPWYGYSRQDKKSAPREPITGRLVAKMLETAGVERVLTMDLHAGQIQGFFTQQVDHMTALPVLTRYFLDRGFIANTVVVSPDVGRVKLAKKFAEKIGADLAILSKERPEQQVAEISQVIGEVQGKVAILVDDIIDTGGTLCAAAQAVLDEGAERVFACATHGIFSGPAFERLAASGIEEIVVTDTVPQSPEPERPANIVVLSCAGILSDSIRRIFTDDSVSEIFAGENLLF